MTPRYADVSILMPYIVVLHTNIARTTTCIVLTINMESCPLMQAHCCIAEQPSWYTEQNTMNCVIIYTIVQRT